MNLDEKNIPLQTFKRLPNYYNYLTGLKKEGVESASSTTIAKALNLNDVQVRKDLAAVSESGGKPRTGFSVPELIGSIGRCLGYYNVNEAILVGAGQLGRALLLYEGFKAYGMQVNAAFDIDPGIANTVCGDKPVFDIKELPEYVRKSQIRIGVITVPAPAAQGVCDLLVENGILAVWNFAPVNLSVPRDVFVLNENMAVSLSLLSQFLSRQTGKMGD